MAICMRELHWAAGFLEGEGSFTAVYGKRPDGRLRAAAAPKVSAGQKDPQSLERLKSLFGGSVYYRLLHYRGKDGKTHDIYTWQVNGRRAIGIMMTLWPLMSEKRRAQIEVAVARWKQNKEQAEGLRAYWTEINNGN